MSKKKIPRKEKERRMVNRNWAEKQKWERGRFENIGKMREREE